MSIAGRIGNAWIAVAMAWGLGDGLVATTAAQPPAWSVPSRGLSNSSDAVQFAHPQASHPLERPLAVMNRDASHATSPPAAPLARVIRTPENSSGLPPYALTDNTNTVQRYVEPVPNIDLEPFVGAVVRVRHDTGLTLLASQLELPTQPLATSLEELTAGHIESAVGGSGELQQIVPPQESPPNAVRQVEFLDDDNATVQLLADTEETLPDGEITQPEESAAAEAAPADVADPNFPEGVGRGGQMESGPMFGEPIDMGAASAEMCDPMAMGMPGMEYGEVGPMECPECGGYHLPPNYAGPQAPGPQQPCGCQADRTHLFADVQFNFLRAHVMENFAGKLSEQFEFSPRVIVGFQGTEKVDGRARYWHFGRNTNVLDDDGTVRFDFDVVDIEATRTLAFSNSALLVAAGARFANIELTDDDGDSTGSNLLGMTLAADFNTRLCEVRQGVFAGVCGARFSLLGGDWGQDVGNDFLPQQIQDDNVVVNELYAGVAYATCYRNLEVHAQLGFEMQNWHSDALSQFAGGDSIGFLGPGIEIGAAF